MRFENSEPNFFKLWSPFCRWKITNNWLWTCSLLEGIAWHLPLVQCSWSIVVYSRRYLALFQYNFTQRGKYMMLLFWLDAKAKVCAKRIHGLCARNLVEETNLCNGVSNFLTCYNKKVVLRFPDNDGECQSLQQAPEISQKFNTLIQTFSTDLIGKYRNSLDHDKMCHVDSTVVDIDAYSQDWPDKTNQFIDIRVNWKFAFQSLSRCSIKSKILFVLRVECLVYNTLSQLSCLFLSSINITIKSLRKFFLF